MVTLIFFALLTLFGVSLLVGAAMGVTDDKGPSITAVFVGGVMAVFFGFCFLLNLLGLVLTRTA